MIARYLAKGAIAKQVRAAIAHPETGVLAISNKQRDRTRADITESLLLGALKELGVYVGQRVPDGATTGVLRLKRLNASQRSRDRR